MKYKMLIAGVILTGASFLLSACGTEQKSPASESASSEQTMKDTKAEESKATADSGKTESSNGGTGFGTFTTTDLDGAAVNQELFKDYDLTMVNIWATFCSPCLREMPELGEINTEYADKGFQIVGIVTDVLSPDATVSDEMMETAKYAVEQTQANYTHLVPSLDLLKGRLKDVSVVPTTIFVDKDGNQVGEIYEGSKAKADWEELIDELLKRVK